MRTPVAHLIIALAVSTLVVTGFNAVSRYVEREHAREMDARANHAALSLYDVPLVHSCGPDRCVIPGAER